MLWLTSSVRNLGIQLRSDLAVNDEISVIVHSCNYNIRPLRPVRSAVSRDALRDAAYAVLLSSLYHCNSLFANVPVTQMRRLQMVVNMAARVVSGRRRFNSNTDFIKRDLS